MWEGRGAELGDSQSQVTAYKLKHGDWYPWSQPGGEAKWAGASIHDTAVDEGPASITTTVKVLNTRRPTLPSEAAQPP